MIKLTFVRTMTSSSSVNSVAANASEDTNRVVYNRYNSVDFIIINSMDSDIQVLYTLDEIRKTHWNKWNHSR